MAHKGIGCRSFLAKRPKLRVYLGYIREDPCTWCQGQAGTVDHIVPRISWRQGVDGELHYTTMTGVHHWSNVTMACRSCNSRRGARGILLYMVQRYRKECKDTS